MQYRQRKLHLSVTETRRSRTTRPKLSTISATGASSEEGTASGMPTQRPPSAQSSFFQMGTVALSSSISSRQPANASARWGAEAATITLGSAAPTTPTRWAR